MPTPRVSGGIIADQTLTGSLKYFKMAGAFAYTVSDGTITLDSSTAGGDPGVTYYYLVGADKPVPESLAELALRQIMEKCNIVEIGILGAVGAETAIHFSAANTSFGWLDAAGAVDTVAMVAAVAALGANVTVPTTTGGDVDDNTVAPVTISRSTTVTIVEVPFLLA